jgi:hypothetical protein
MTINLTFCGDWAGSVWQYESTCKNLAATCTDYVRNYPSVRSRRPRPCTHARG